MYIHVRSRRGTNFKLFISFVYLQGVQAGNGNTSPPKGPDAHGDIIQVWDIQKFFLFALGKKFNNVNKWKQMRV